MQRSELINELAAALSKAQAEIKPASKDSENPFFRSKYADLSTVWESVRPALTKNGLSVTQHVESDGNLVRVETVLLHASGQWISSVITITAKDPMPQSIGSAITYARRYGLSAVVGASSEEDDDGNNAMPGRAPIEAKKGTVAQIKPILADDQRVNSEQGKALLAILAKNGYTAEDLQDYIGNEFGLNSLPEITNGRLLKIKEHFSKVKAK